MRPALIVIDLQRWFLDRGTSEKIARVPALLAGSNELIDFFHSKGLPIVHILTVHKHDGSTWDLWMKRHNEAHLLEGTEEAEEHPEVHRFDADVVVEKTRHSAFIRTELESILRGMGVDALVLAGFAINGCVGLTAIEAYERDFHVLLARDAILGHTESSASLMLKYLHDEFGIEPIASSAIMERTAAESADRM